MTQPVYIQRMGATLPGPPVANKDMEDRLGQVGDKPSRERRLVLRSNGIRQRHYAIDPETGDATYNNAQLTAGAIQNLAGSDFDTDDMDLLACGTSTPDLLMPGHASMVHGELGTPPCEIASLSGICGSGVNALRYATLAVGAGQADTAVATGSDMASGMMHAGMFDADAEQSTESLEQQPEKAFHRDFLRWMLSDGAGAMLLRRQPNPAGCSLRINWIEQRSFANQLETCMYAGGNKEPDGRMKGWREYASPQEAARAGAFPVKQDVRLLNDNIAHITIRQGLAEIGKKRALAADDFDWFVPHYSSEYFRPKLMAAMKDIGFEIPESRWFTNLTEVGNVGAASIYLMLHDLLAGEQLKPGQNILCFVPESGRFSTAFMHLTVTDSSGSPA